MFRVPGKKISDFFIFLSIPHDLSINHQDPKKNKKYRTKPSILSASPRRINQPSQKKQPTKQPSNQETKQPTNQPTNPSLHPSPACATKSCFDVKRRFSTLKRSLNPSNHSAKEARRRTSKSCPLPEVKGVRGILGVGQTQGV